MENALARLIIFTICWFIFYGLGTLRYPHGDGALYWDQGAWGILLLGPLFCYVDAKLREKEWYAARPLITLTSAILTSYVLYIPLIFVFFFMLFMIDVIA